MPPIGLSGKSFPIHLKPKGDELLSSWLVRLSIAHGLSPSDLDRILYPVSNVHLWGLDIDLGSKRNGYPQSGSRDRLFSILSEKTGTPLDKVRRTTLDEYEKRLFYRLYGRNLYSWILPSDFNPSRQSRGFGMQACPLCLDRDGKPYFRRRWRLAFVVVCPQHACRLIDRCNVCGAPIRFNLSATYLTHSASNAMTTCHKCWSDYRHSFGKKRDSIVRVSQDMIEFQERLVQLANQDDLKVTRAETVSTEECFEVLNRMLSLIIQPRAYGQALRTAIAGHYGLNLAPSRYANKPNTLESLDIGRRYELVWLLKRLLEDAPAQYLRPSHKKDLSCRIWLYEWQNTHFWRLGVLSDRRKPGSRTGWYKNKELGVHDLYLYSRTKRAQLINPTYLDEFRQAAAQLFLDGVRNRNIARFLGVAHVDVVNWTKEHPASAAIAVEAGTRGVRKS